MHKFQIAILVCTTMLSVTSCSTAGPFVSGMYKDNDEIIVKKCNVRFTPVIPIYMIWGMITEENCVLEKVGNIPILTTPAN